MNKNKIKKIIKKLIRKSIKIEMQTSAFFFPVNLRKKRFEETIKIQLKKGVIFSFKRINHG